MIARVKAAADRRVGIVDICREGPVRLAHGCYNCLSFSMRILMIAPEPFFEPRGTPFSEYHRIRALLELGHTVDLVTYPFGRDVTLPGLRVFRCARPPLMTGIGIGPSWRKLPLDFALLLDRVPARDERRSTTRSTRTKRAAGSASILAGLLGLPHLYDMHSSLPQQLTNFAYSRSRLVNGAFELAGALRHPALARRDRDLPAARGGRARRSTRPCRRC